MKFDARGDEGDVRKIVFSPLSPGYAPVFNIFSTFIIVNAGKVDECCQKFRMGKTHLYKFRVWR